MTWSVAGLALGAMLGVLAPGDAAIAAELEQVSIPHAVGQDSAGNQFMVYQQGQLRQQGGNAVFSQGARLTVNGQEVNVRRPTVMRNPDTGEVIFERTKVGHIEVERRVRAMEGGYVRYVDIFHNPTAEDVKARLQLQTHINYGIQSSQVVEDSQKAGEPIAWVAQTAANRAAVEVYAGQRSPVKLSINPAQGNVVTAVLAVTVPKNDSIAIVHLHATADDAAKAREWVLELKEKEIFDGVSADVRKRVINFRRSAFDIGSYELLREEVYDVVELHGGDQFRGTLRQDGYHLNTFYGRIDLPVERVIGLINVGQIRPRQLVVTRDGEVFGGTLDTTAITLELSTGQRIEMPMERISRIGYRKRADEPEEWTFAQPLVFLQLGDRVMVQPPATPIEVVTRYGTLSLDASAIAILSLQSEDHGVHEVLLRDGSRFAALATASAFDMELAEGKQVARFQISSLLRLQMAAPPDQPDPDSGVFTVANGDVLVGTLSGQLQLQTAFATIDVNAREIKRLTRPPEQGWAVQVVMWDNTSFTGQLQQDVLQLDLDSGVQVQVPVSLVATYEHPLPQPSGTVRDQILAIVADLDADDWRQRDRAQAQLVSMGVSVISVLEELRAHQSPEAQQRIDQVIEELRKQRDSRRSSAQPVGSSVRPAGDLNQAIAVRMELHN